MGVLTYVWETSYFNVGPGVYHDDSRRGIGSSSLNFMCVRVCVFVLLFSLVIYVSLYRILKVYLCPPFTLLPFLIKVY